jgi:putrescine:ornithine antiporter
VADGQFKLNMSIAVVGMLYSTYAIYASGKDAVLGGTIVLALTFLIYGFIAPRFTSTAAAPARA